MNQKFLSLIFASVLLTGGTAMAQNAPATSRQGGAKADRDATYGRVKEFTAGQRLVIDVDNAPDKSFDLTDRSKALVTVPANLKVGDPVKLMETEKNGQKMVQVMHDTSGAKHGDKTRTEERQHEGDSNR